MVSQSPLDRTPFVIQTLGRAVLAEERSRAHQLHQVIQCNYLRSSQPVRYHLLRKTWRPIDRRRQETFDSEVSLGEFDMGEKQSVASPPAEAGR